MAELMRRLGTVAALGVLVASVWGTKVLHPTVFDHPGRTIACLFAVFLVASLVYLDGFKRRLSEWIFQSRRSVFDAVVFGVAVLWFSYLSFDLFQGLPHLDDAVASLYQAQIFLTGKVTLPHHEHGHFFAQFGVLSAEYGATRLCGMYPLGWPLLLAIGESAHVAWLVNPLLGGLLAVFTGRLASRLFDARTGRVAALLCLFSPFVGIMSATHLSHNATALGGVVGWWAGLRMLETRRWRDGFIAGGGLGLAFLCRPLPAILVGVVLGLGLMVGWRWQHLLRAWKGIVAACLMLALSAGLLMAFQKEVTGDAFTPGHKLGLASRGRIGFVKLDHVRTHTPELGAEYSRRRLVAMNMTLAGWPLPAMLLGMLPFFVRGGRWKELWLLGPLIALLGLFAMFWYWEEYYPARYIYEAMPFMLILMARGWAILVDLVRSSPRVVRAIPTVWVAGGILFAVGCSNRDLYKYYTPQHGDVENILPQVVEQYGITNALVMMDSMELRLHWGTHWLSFAKGDQGNKYYATGFIRNGLELDDDVVYAWNRPPDKVPWDRPEWAARKAAMIATYPGRNYYLYRFDRGADRARLYRFEFKHGKIGDRIPVPLNPGCKLLMPDSPRMNGSL